ncbi:MAG: dephospho-CoA kinase [Longimicrobiales bacterium]
MGPFVDQLAPLLSRYGPGLVFAMTLLETACFFGLLVPAEATILLAALLAHQGVFSIEAVFIATFAGGFAGDQIGYALGRFGGSQAASSNGRIGKIWRRNEVRAHSLFRRQAILAISAARFVSFVRTLTPWLAGMSNMRYRRYVIYDAIGVAAWAAVSVALGYFLGESWDAISRILDVVSIIVLIAAAATIYVAFKRMRGRRAGVAAASVATQKPLYRVGLTGNIASGKSTVAGVWRSLGAHVIDADELARIAVAPGSASLRGIHARFGDQVMEPWGDLNRAALRKLVFGDTDARRALEAIVHPEVERLRAIEESTLLASGAAIVVNMIPLLFEASMQDAFDEIVFVDAPDDVRMERLMKTRNLSAGDARAMMDAQMSPDDKRDLVDHVLDNEGNIEQLKERAAQIWRGIEERACE